MVSAASKGKANSSFGIEKFIRVHWRGFLARIRGAYWRHVLAACGKDFFVGGKIWVVKPENVSVGDDVHLSEGVYINARDTVSIGNHTRLSPFVRINTAGLVLDVPPSERFDHPSEPVTIGEYVWLATGVIVNAGVTIHDGVIVGAGAVVTRDLPPYTLCIGVPAKPIRELPRA
jgi:acetyltransferase-like isoleucine patch superfamily enzyme